jgi:hypothetical protein
MLLKFISQLKEQGLSSEGSECSKKALPVDTAQTFSLKLIALLGVKGLVLRLCPSAQQRVLYPLNLNFHA